MGKFFGERLYTRREMKYRVVLPGNVTPEEEIGDLVDAAFAGMDYEYWKSADLRYVSVTCCAPEQRHLEEALASVLVGWELVVMWRPERKDVRPALYQLATSQGWALIRPDGTRCWAVRGAIEKSLEGRRIG